MTESTTAPYGSWASPFPIERLTEGVVFLGEARGSGGVRWGLEGGPEEGGRQGLVRRDPNGTVSRLTPEGFNARTRVQEYGGAATLVSGDLVVVSDFATGRLQRVTAPGVLAPLTPDRAWRFADLEHDGPRGRLYAVREDHDPDVIAAHGEWVNELVTIDLANGEVEVMAGGADFCAAPRLSPDGRTLAWLEWRHPNMPWDGTELKLAPVGEGGSVGQAITVAGSASDWISQPRSSPPRRPRRPRPAWRAPPRRPPLRRRARRLDDPPALPGRRRRAGRADGGRVRAAGLDLRDRQLRLPAGGRDPGGRPERGPGPALPDRSGRRSDHPRPAVHGDRLGRHRRQHGAPARCLALRAGRAHRARSRDIGRHRSPPRDAVRARPGRCPGASPRPLPHLPP